MKACSSLPRAVLLWATLASVLPACSEKNAATENPAAAAASAPAGASAPGAQGSGARNRPQVVSTTRSRIADVPVTLHAQGNVLPLDEVDVRPQKTGTVAQTHVREGEEVQRGQLLFSLDDREDAAAVRRTEAAVAGAQAQVDIAQRDLQRTQDLSSKNFVSSSALDTARNKLDSARAALLQQQAALEEVRVTLSHSTIRAPFDGRAGSIDVRPGSLVTSATSMVKITRMNPIGVSFTLPERELPGLLAAQRAKPVRVEIEADGGRKLGGTVSFIDSTVDRTAGTIAVKARVDNAARSLWPGQYVNVRIAAGERKGAVVLPVQAVINGPNNRFVYAVQDDQTVVQREVQVEGITDGQAIVTGLPGGVKVVLEGGQNLRPGGRIEESNPGTAGNGERRGPRRNGGSGSEPVGQQIAAQPAGAAGQRARPPAAAGQSAPAAGAPAQAARNTGGGVVIPEGFKPRDPEAWARMSDEEKAERIARWRERRQSGGGNAP